MTASPTPHDADARLDAGVLHFQQITICNDAQSQIRDPAVIRASNPPDCESGWTQTLAIVIY
jgi:hypothetical protein